MGGLITLYSTLKGMISPKALALSAPLLRLPSDPLPHGIAKPLSALLNALKLGKVGTGAGRHERRKFENNKLTHSIEMYNRCQNSPFQSHSANFAWIDQTFRAADFVFNPENLKTLNVPTLVLSADQERVIDAGSSLAEWVQVCSQATRAPIKLEVIHGARHEIFSEIPKVRDKAISKVRGWFGDFFG